MAIIINGTNETNVLEIRLSGKLAHVDYQLFVPAFEHLLKTHTKPRLLVEMVDFHGWELSALWDDIKFDAKHFSDIDRIAMVGEKQWEKGMSVFCRPFTTAKVRYFDRAQINEAREWLLEHQPVAA